MRPGSTGTVSSMQSSHQSASGAALGGQATAGLFCSAEAGSGPRHSNKNTNRNVYLCLTGAIWLQAKAFSTCIFCAYHMLGMAKGEAVFMGSSGTKLLVQEALAASLIQARLEAHIPSLKYGTQACRSLLPPSQRCHKTYCELHGGLKGPSTPYRKGQEQLVSPFSAITPTLLFCKLPGC